MLTDRSRPRYDKGEIRRRTADVAAHYLGPGRDEGARIVWDCPACRKEGKLALRKEDGLFGCFVEGCRLAGGADVFDFIAYMDGLDPMGGFIDVLKRGYDVLGFEAEQPPAERRTETKQAHSNASREDRPKPGPEELEKRLALCHEVYARIMAHCRLEGRDRKYLRLRGLSDGTIRNGRFGSISLERARCVKKVLLEELGEEKLLSVPGFFKDRPSGRIGFTLSGDYLLIPYHDRRGNITTIEGRTMGEIPEGMGKYVSLRGSGNHLYLFPGTEPEELVAFTEGSFGAIVAAESGIAVASIQGCERYKASFSSFAPDGEKDEPLLEIKGANFRGKTIPYIPDSDDPPNEKVLKAAPKAAHHLIVRQGGKATLCTLPKGMDLDEWLLDQPKEQRRQRFAELISEATPLERAEEWKRAQRDATDENENNRSARRRVDTTSGEHCPEEATEAPLPANTGSHKEANCQHGFAEADPGEQPAPDEARREPEQEGGGGEENPDPDGHRSSKKPTGAQKLKNEVYGKLLAKCPAKGEHKGALARLGVIEEAVVAGKLGSLDAGRASRVSAELKEEFGAKRLLSVPGFERSHSGRISLSLPGKGEYVLLPCFDARGLLAGVEALEYDPERGELADPDRTVPLSGAGAHLYVFAPYSPQEIEGFCEGPLAAILAAQEDVVLGAIGHFRRYAPDAGSTKNEGRVGAVLPELEGVDFGGREIAYLPRVGPGEENARSREARAACRFLVEKQNGVAHLAFPSSPERAAGHDDAAGGEQRPKDAAPRSLSEWILSLPEEDRQERLKELFSEGHHRNEPSPGSDPREEDERARGGAGQAGGERRRESPEVPASSALATVLLMAAIAAVVDLLVWRAEAFGYYVGVGYGGQPFVGGGLVGQLRDLARSAPMETLYALREPVSLLMGVAVGVGRLRSRTKLQRLSEDLQRFTEGPWSAHLVGEQERASRAPSKAPVTLREVLEGLFGGALSYALLSLLLGAAGSLYGAMASMGLARGSYGALFEGSGRIALIGGVACGLYVLARRAALRRQKTKLIEGKIEP